MLTAFIACAFMAQQQPNPKDVFFQVNRIQTEPGSLFSVIKALETARDEAPDANERSKALQMLATAYSFAGEIALAHETFDKDDRGGKPSSIPTSHDLDGYQRIDAIDAILREAKGRQIVIVNEAHHVPQTRLVTLRLLDGLRKQGFAYFAAETFTNYKPFEMKAFPRLDNGFYSVEPMFGQMLRNVLRLGYKPAPYEVNIVGEKGVNPIEHRETNEKDNLMANIFRKDPKAKVVIHVGYSHEFEAPDAQGNLWMAARLKKETGIDPLTIDTTVMTEHSTRDAESVAYKYADSKGWLKSPTVFRKRDGGFYVGGVAAGRSDIQVFFPRTTMRGGRPAWMFQGAGRRPVRLPSEIKVLATRTLVEVSVAGEPADAVPFDRLILWPGKPAPKLALAPGRYVARQYDESSKVVAVAEVTVR